MYIPTTTIPNYIPAPAQPCPSCGRCPSCGQGANPFTPYQNIGINPYPNWGSTVTYHAGNMPQFTYTATQ